MFNSTGQSPYIIAEVGGNHNGDFGKAKEMVVAAAEAGADAAKFQTYTPEKLCHPSQPPVPILKNRYKNQRERFAELVFTDQQYTELKNVADENGIDFVSSPFDLDCVDMLDPLVPFFKVASGDINNIPLLKKVTSRKKWVVVSTGMASLAEVDRLLEIIPQERLAILHCVSIYPTPPEEVRLNMIQFLKRRYPKITIGYSDHFPGTRACVYAAVLGAAIIEKHFTFDKSIGYGDHGLSADYADMKNMVDEIRHLSVILGTVGWEKSELEERSKTFFRRGVYAQSDLPSGKILTSDDVILLRPPASIDADQVDQIIGKKTNKAISKEDVIKWEDLQ